MRYRYYSRVVESAGGFRKVFFAGFYYALVDFHDVDFIYTVVFAKLARDSPVAGAYNKNAFGVRIHRHGDVRYHLVVDKLVLLGQHHVAVER